MPSWNIHTAHVESLLDERSPEELGIADANAFLFGNYVPDIYVGFMVPDTTFHLDYCLTHHSGVHVIPVPDADDFWDSFVFRRRPKSPSGSSLTIGAWAHLLADRVYNKRFRDFCEANDVPRDDERRVGKQADFALFGNSLGISSTVQVTPDLLEAARGFRPYTVLPEDLERSVTVATSIVRENGGVQRSGADAARGGDARFGSGAACGDSVYRLLSAEWMEAAFAECDGFLKAWLQTWQQLELQGHQASSNDIRAEMGTRGDI